MFYTVYKIYNKSFFILIINIVNSNMILFNFFIELVKKGNKY